MGFGPTAFAPPENTWRARFPEALIGSGLALSASRGATLNTMENLRQSAQHPLRRPRSALGSSAQLEGLCYKGQGDAAPREANLWSWKSRPRDVYELGTERLGLRPGPGWAGRKTSWLPHPQQDVFSAPCDSRSLFQKTRGDSVS